MANRNPTKLARFGFGLALLALAPLVHGQLPPPPLPAGTAAGPGLPAAAAVLSAAPSPVPIVIPAGLSPANRDPFWPVGYRPKSREEIERERRLATASQKPVSPPRWEEAQALMRIGGSMRTPRGFTALINGELVKAGDIVSLRFKEKLYRWKIDSVALSGVSLSPLDFTPIEQLPNNPGKDRP